MTESIIVSKYIDYMPEYTSVTLFTVFISDYRTSTYKYQQSTVGNTQ